MTVARGVGLMMVGCIVCGCGESRPPGASASENAGAAASPQTAASVVESTSDVARGERRAAQAETPAVTPPDTIAVGVVRVQGAHPAPMLNLASPSGGRVALRGAIQAELRALVGIEVEVRGRVGPNSLQLPPRAIDVASYRVLSVNGRRPEVGLLAADGDVLMLNRKQLVGAPEEMRQVVGGKVWVLGVESDEGLVVEAFGVIRRP